MLAESTTLLIALTGRQILVMAILVLYLGKFIKQRSGFLQRNNIPASVIGGVISSCLIAVLGATGLVELSFDMELRNILILLFFSTLGLNSKFKTLIQGGRALLIFIVPCALYLVVQNVLGVSVAALLGKDPLMGLYGGSIAFAGGHGTAIAWGEMAAGEGFPDVADFGMACATLGLIMGGLLGGPVAGRLIKKHDLSSDDDPLGPSSTNPKDEEVWHRITVDRVIGTLLALGLCLALGDAVNRYLFSYQIRLPGFLTAMMVGLLVTNIAEPLKISLRPNVIDVIGGVSLQLFLCMSLMSMDLLALMNSAVLLLVVAAVQVIGIIWFATHVVFRMMGKNYDAAVMVGGFIGLGLGATPVAIASMDAVSTQHGTSAKALLVVPLVGAFFIDLINAAVIQGFLQLPFM